MIRDKKKEEREEHMIMKEANCEKAKVFGDTNQGHLIESTNKRNIGLCKEG